MWTAEQASHMCPLKLSSFAKQTSRNSVSVYEGSSRKSARIASCFGRWVRQPWTTYEYILCRVFLRASVYFFLFFFLSFKRRREGESLNDERKREESRHRVLPARKTRSDHRYQLSHRYPSVIQDIIYLFRLPRPSASAPSRTSRSTPLRSFSPFTATEVISRS